MLKLLNETVGIFNKLLDWDASSTKRWLIVIEVILAAIILGLVGYIVLQKLKGKRKQPVATAVADSVATEPTVQNPEVIYVQGAMVEEERVLTGISLDLGIVQREFEAGDEFSCEGLVVQAEYNVKPTVESLVDYTLIDEDTYRRLAKHDKTNGVYVIKPNLKTLGTKVVTVIYQDQTVAYTISVNKRSEVKPETVVRAEPTTIVVEKPVMVEKAVEKTRELLSISLNTEQVQKEYTVGDAINHDGLVVTANYSVEPMSEVVSDYSVLPPDMGKAGKPTVTVTYQGKTVGYQITVKAAEAERVEEVEQPGVVVHRSNPIIVEEETVSTRLRYDKSFTARLIQSDDETKCWYTEIKNELLCYKNVKGRISWKRETFKSGAKLVLAKLAYRGKILCVFLPLKTADYAEKYHIEDASDMSCYEDTPLMIRLKNPKRVEVAIKLIQKVMEENGLKRVPHEAVDYYMPYEGILDLIKKGLIKRDIRSAKDEAIFERDGVSDNDEDESFALEEIAPGVYVTRK